MLGPCLPRLLRPLLPRVSFEGLIRWKESYLFHKAMFYDLFYATVCLHH